jgi:hypothetical protein
MINKVLVLSAGMPRAGSGWHYNLVHDLVVAGGGKDARQVRRAFHLEGLLTEVNCNLSTLTAFRLLPVYLPVMLGTTYAIKTHAGPTPTARLLIRFQRLLVTYIYRDPRAALLSAYEYGRRGQEQGKTNAFSHLDSLESAALFIKPYLKIWEAWIEDDRVFKVRYEDLLSDYDREFNRLAGKLGLPAADRRIGSVKEKYRPNRAGSGQIGTHFNIGKPGRFREVLTTGQMDSLNQALEPHLKKMGYSI